MEPLLLGIALGAGALLVAKRGRGAIQNAVGWTARKGGWLAGRVRTSLDETRTVARAQFERGRVESAAGARVAASASASAPGPSSLSEMGANGHAPSAKV